MVFDKIAHERPYSNETAREIDAEVAALVREAASRAESVITHNRKALDALANALIEHETLEEEAVAEILKDATLPKEAALY